MGHYINSGYEGKKKKTNNNTLHLSKAFLITHSGDSAGVI